MHMCCMLYSFYFCGVLPVCGGMTAWCEDSMFFNILALCVYHYLKISLCMCHLCVIGVCVIFWKYV